MTLICETAVCLALVISGALEAAQPPPVTEMPLGLTNYNLFAGGEVALAWNGQANGDPAHYGNNYPTDPSHQWRVGACIQDWTKRWQGEGSVSHTTAVSFTWQGEARELACYDTFGAVAYRRPFYHPGYGQWIIPVDVLTDEPVYGLVWEWHTTTVVIGEIDQ